MMEQTNPSCVRIGQNFAKFYGIGKFATLDVMNNDEHA
jgi:hypothetical protein